MNGQFNQTIHTRDVEMVDDDVVMQHIADRLTADVANTVTR